jgi:pimeloyl-ACP methyl ester carboxylesterase
MLLERRISIAICLLAIVGLATHAKAQSTQVIAERYATANGVRLHYLVAGTGSPVILLHGYAQNSHMWRPLMKELAKTHRVVAPDLRGFGTRPRLNRATTRKRMAQDVHALAQSLGIKGG